MSGLIELVEDRRVVVCCGTGGVGKTTTAAVLGLAAARRGRNAIVVTIDPAKRLADTLGLVGLGNTAHEIPRARWDDGAAPPTGRLSALMLDTRATFDGLVRRYARDEEQAGRILANGFYRNIASALSGTQEYMAMEKLHELHEDGGYDLIVVDTPPSRHALDFLDAPQRLTRLLDNRIFRFLMMPTRTYVRVASSAVQRFLRTVGKVIGGDVLDDIVAFFRVFEGMEAGFRARAARVRRAAPRAHHRVRAHHVAAPRRRRRSRVLRRPPPRRGAGCRRPRREPGPPRLRGRRPGRAPPRAGPRRAGRVGATPRRVSLTGTRTSPTTPRSATTSGAASPTSVPASAPPPSPTSRPSPTTSSTSSPSTRWRGCSSTTPTHPALGNVSAVTTVIVAADGAWLRNQLRASLAGADQTVLELDRGQDVRDAVATHEPDLVILDLQIGNMGGIAVAIDLRLEASAGRTPDVPIVLLLDRECDRFLAKRADVDAVVVKPLDAGVLRRTVKQVLADRVNV